MNLTEPTTVEEALTLFAQALVALARHPELRLPFAPERHEGSYYRPAFRPAMGRADMECGGEIGELGELALLWAGTALEPLLPRLASLAQAIARDRAVPAQNTAQDFDVPAPSIYPMY